MCHDAVNTKLKLHNGVRNIDKVMERTALHAALGNILTRYTQIDHVRLNNTAEVYSVSVWNTDVSSFFFQQCER